MNTLDSLNSTQKRGESVERAATEPPLTFTRALKRNPFFRDEDGQAMVEMAIIAPFLMFAMVSVMYYWGTADMQQDYYIRSANDYWAVVANGHNPSAQGRTVAASDQNMGIGNMIAALGIPLPGSGLISGVGDINGVMSIGLAAMALLDGDFSGNPIQALTASAGVFGLLPPGTPYERMGLMKNDDYDKTDTTPYAYDNPWRNTVMGMVSFFGSSRGGTQEDPVTTIFPSPLNMYANFRMINGPTWHCNRAPEGTEWRDYIGQRSCAVTAFSIPAWGNVVQGNMALASPLWFIVEGIAALVGLAGPETAYNVTKYANYLPSIINPSGAHNPYAFKIDVGKGLFGTSEYETYQTERLLGFPTGPGNLCATLGAGNAEEMWR